LKQYPPVSFFVLLLSVVGVASCVDHRHHRIAFASPAASSDDLAFPALPMIAGSPHTKPTNDGRIVLVTIDGVRAEDVFDGADPALRPGSHVERFTRPEAVMPRTHRLVETRGVALGADRPGCGVVRTASGANVSLPGYLEIFTGRKTRCRDNHCGRTELPTVLDEAAETGLAPVASIGSWEILSRAASRTGAPVLVAEGSLRWPGERPLVPASLEELVAAGERVEAFPGVGQYRPDASTAAIALAYLRSAKPPVLHVGLGDPDEYGHRNDYPAYLGAIAAADAFIGELADTLDTMGDLGTRTTVIVTTDHGRNQDFQHHGAMSLASARSFVIAFGARVASRGVVCPSRDVTLADIAPTIRVLAGLVADTSPDAGRPIEEIVGAPAATVALRERGERSP
jgi:hypothetical protein